MVFIYIVYFTYESIREKTSCLCLRRIINNVNFDQNIECLQIFLILLRTYQWMSLSWGCYHPKINNINKLSAQTKFRKRKKTLLQFSRQVLKYNKTEICLSAREVTMHSKSCKQNELNQIPNSLKFYKIFFS